MDSFTTNDRFYIKALISDHYLSKSSIPFKSYVIYEVTIETIHKKWIIEKRYKEFEKLHNELSKSNFRLPKFPEKKLFKVSDEVVKERTIKLTEYLNLLFKSSLVLSHQRLHEFLEINPLLYQKLISKFEITDKTTNFEDPKKRSKSDFSIEYKKHNHLGKSDKFDCAEYLSKKKYLTVHTLLSQLELDSENTCEHIKNFWEYIYIQQRKKPLNSNEINKLLYGYNNTNRKNGLMYKCGKIKENLLGSEACLDLICKLLDYETNPDCETFINCFRNSDKTHIEYMMLYNHLNSKRTGIKTCVYKIIKTLLTNENGNLIENIMKNDLIMMKNFEDFLKTSI